MIETVKNEKVKKRRKGLETKQTILDTAATLFAQNGYDGVSMRNIAEKTDIKESSLYNHFKCKADILETLFDNLIKLIPQTRPSEDEIEKMLMFMEPEEIFKNIVFHVGKNVSRTILNTVIIINYERFRNLRASEIYFKCLIKEPINYYQCLINKMIERKMIKSVDANIIAEQYNYVSNSLTNEYVMAQNGYADMNLVIKNMVKSLKFFCGIMANDNSKKNENGGI